MSKRKRTPLIFAIIGLFIVNLAIFNGLVIDRWIRDYSAGKGFAQSLPTDQILLQLFGFREFLAGILWVRADAFFDQGNYDAVLPIIRLCTILDPKQIDIYSTGMWHIAYNFTDEEQRSDRRYIPSALALGKEGSRQNAHTYEVFFETGWIWYHKVDDDYDQAVKWWEEAHKRDDMIQGRRNLLSNAYFRNNQVQQGLDMYFRLFDEAEKTHQANPDSYGAFQIKETIENNIDTTIVRMVQRGTLAQLRNDGSFDNGAYDTRPAFDVGFSVRVTVEEPRVLRVQGTWGVDPVGTRIRMVVRDADMVHGRPAAMNWDYRSDVDLDPPRDVTFMQDQLYVKNRRFNRRVDMSKDPTMYPFSTQRYVIEFYYNPRSAPPHIQDKFGYNGEGMTDKNFLRNDIRPGQNVIYAVLELDRDQMLRRGEWSDRVPVLQTKNFDPAALATVQREMIVIPSLRETEINVRENQ
jgi:tetratricopeptide (TPR) repeat protein